MFKIRYGDHLLLRPGSHRVAANLTGYYPLDTQIEVSRASDQSIELKLLKLPGLVTLTTEPEAQARVLLDGMPFGETPLTDAEITPGLHRIELSADRFLSQTLELEVRGASERQSLIAKLTPNWAPVTLATQPAGATVLVDGVSAGVTPLEMQLTAGEREIEARLSGYNAWTDKVLVSAGMPIALPDVRLTQADGRVEIVSTPAEANVSIDGEFRGRTPLNIRLSPGRSHQLTLTKPGYETSTRDLSDRGRQRPQAANRPDRAIRRDRAREQAGRRGGLGRRRAPRRDADDAHAHGREPRHRGPAGGLRERDAEGHAAARVSAEARVRAHGARSELRLGLRARAQDEDRPRAQS